MAALDADSTDPGWRPSASRDRLLARAQLYAAIRRFFAERQVLEVETPALSRYANSDPNIDSFKVGSAADRHTYYLHTSPEFAMKRLLAAGSGPIYQVCKVFRAAECGRHHNPEFSMLEWYRPGFGLADLMREVQDLLEWVCPGWSGLEKITRLTYQAAFQTILNIDPLRASVADLGNLAVRQGIQVQGLSLCTEDHDAWLDLLFSHCIQPALAKQGCCFIYDFPASQAALARLSKTKPETAARFEVFIEGIELCNGYDELTDPQVLQTRIHAEQRQRERRGQPVYPSDPWLGMAMEHGLPPCSGVALGLDRLLMLLLGQQSLDEVLAFPGNHG